MSEEQVEPVAEVRRQPGALKEWPAFGRGEEQIVLLIIRPQFQPFFCLPVSMLSQRA